MRFDIVAQRMTELNDPKKGDLNITQARSALRCFFLTLAERDSLQAMAYVVREMQRYKKEQDKKFLRGFSKRDIREIEKQEKPKRPDKKGG